MLGQILRIQQQHILTDKKMLFEEVKFCNLEISLQSEEHFIIFLIFTEDTSFQIA